MSPELFCLLHEWGKIHNKSLDYTESGWFPDYIMTPLKDLQRVSEFLDPFLLVYFQFMSFSGLLREESACFLWVYASGGLGPASPSPLSLSHPLSVFT